MIKSVTMAEMLSKNKPEEQRESALAEVRFSKTKQELHPAEDAFSKMAKVPAEREKSVLAAGQKLERQANYEKYVKDTSAVPQNFRRCLESIS